MMIPLEPSLLEEGLILHFAQRMLAGEHLYRDLVYFSGPLPYELLAALFRVFGEEVVVARGALALLLGAGTACTFTLARRAGAGMAAHAAAGCIAAAPVLMFPLFSTYFYTTLAVPLCLLAAWASLRGLRDASWAFAAGAAVACVALTKQNLGVVAALGFLAAVAACTEPGRRLRQCGWLVAGGVSVAVATLAVYGLRGDLAVFVHSLVVMPLELDASFTTRMLNLWPPGEFAPEISRSHAFYVPHLYNILTGPKEEVGRAVVLLTQMLYALPFLALGLPLLRRAIGRKLPAAVWMHEAVLLTLAVNLFPRSDWGHLVFALPSAMAHILLSLGANAGESRSRTGPFAERAASVLILLALAAAAAGFTLALYRISGPPTFGPRVPQRPASRATLDPGVPRAIQHLRDHTKPGDAIFVARAEPLIYFATGTRNPTPYSGVLPVLREEQQRVIVEALDDVRFVVMSEIDQPHFLFYRDELPAVAAAFERHFRVPEAYRVQPSWIVVLERGPDRGATLIDFFELWRTGDYWVRDATGRIRAPDAIPPEFANRQNRRPLPVPLGALGGGVDFVLQVPADAEFQADIGLGSLSGPDGEVEHARGTRLEVQVRRQNAPGAADGFETLASQVVRRRGKPAGTWTPLEVDLAKFAGETVTLRLQASRSRPRAEGGLAWWGSPRIALRPSP